MARIESPSPGSAAIQEREVDFDAPVPEFDDEAALRLVLQDADTYDSWHMTQQWLSNWREAEILYQSPRNVSAWEGSTVTRANVSRFTVAKHVNAIAPQLYNGLFFDSPPFKLRPRPSRSEQVTRAWEGLLTTLLDMADFQATCKRYFIVNPLFGTGVVKWGWCSEERTEKRWERSGAGPSISLPLGQELKLDGNEKFVLKERKIVVRKPFLELIDNRRLKVSPSTRVGDIRYAKWVIYEDYLNYYDLEALRNDENYSLPDEDELKSYFFDPKEPPAPPSAQTYGNAMPQMQQAQRPDVADTADPLANALQVLERVDQEGRIITVLNRKLVIRNGQNDLGCINYLSSNWWDVPNSFWGMGIGRIIGQDQRVDTGVTNAALDVLASKVNWTALRQRGSNAPSQPIRQRMGGIYDVDGDPSKAFHILETPNVPPEVWMALQNSRAEAESASGANEQLVMGQLPAQPRTSMGRTATGAGAMAAASASRLQGPMDMFVDQIYKPFLYACVEMVKERMPLQEIKDILGDQFDEDFVKGLDLDEFYNAKLDFEILASGRMQAKRAMAQSLPLMFSLFSQPSVTEDLALKDQTVDWTALVKRMEEVSDWRYSESIIRPLTDQEKQARAQNNAAAQQMQGKATLQDQKFQQQQQLEDQKNFGRAANQVLRVIEERTMQGGPVGTGAAREGFTGE